MSSSQRPGAATAIAILDDYANNAPRHFQQFDGLQVDYFAETLNPARPDGLEALVQRLKPYPIISSMRERTPFPAELQRQLPNLKLFLTTGMRNAAIDLQSASSLGIVITGTKSERPTHARKNDDVELPPPSGYSAVNQHAWALLLSLCSRIPQDDRALKTVAGAWQSGLGVSLGGKTLGIVGLGKLGVAMAKVAVLAFGMEVIAWSESLTQARADAAAQDAGLAAGTFRAVGKEQVFGEADVVSLHYVLSSRSRGLVGSRELGWMKKSALLLNTSRGPLIDEDALRQALQRGEIAGVAMDVFWEEPLPANSPWREVDSWAKSAVVLSPHMGYVNMGNMNRMYEEQAEIVQYYLDGKELPNKLN